MKNLDRFLTQSPDDLHQPNNDQTIIFLCGVHGAGKSTIGKALKEDMDRVGIRSYYVPEMNLKPTRFVPGQLNFQKWYAQEMEYRDMAIRGLLKDDVRSPDVLIIDRCKTDVEVYSRFYNEDNWDDLAHELVFEMTTLLDLFTTEDKDIYIHNYVVTRETDSILSDLAKRMVDEEIRKKWNEARRTKIQMLDGMFREVWTKAQAITDTMSDVRDANLFIDFLHNTNTVNDAVNFLREDVIV